MEGFLLAQKLKSASIKLFILSLRFGKIKSLLLKAVSTLLDLAL